MKLSTSVATMRAGPYDRDPYYGGGRYYGGVY